MARQLQRDDHRTKHEERRDQERGAEPAPPGEETKNRASEPKRHVEKGCVGAHGGAAAFRRCAPHRFDTETRKDQRIAKTGHRGTRKGDGTSARQANERQANCFNGRGCQGDPRATETGRTAW